MNFFEKFLYFLQGEMNEPTPFGWFHLMWIGIIIVSLFILFILRKKYSEKQLKTVLAIYGIVAFILEGLKQIIWSFNYDPINNIVSWDYQWYAAPFQLCSTPIYVSLICLFLKKNKLRNSLLSYMAYITILGGITTIILPESCFVSDILINIHTMWLHCGSFVVSVYLLMSGEVKIDIKSLRNAFLTFLVFVIIAEGLNIGIYNSGILNGETFDMFYISPYFISTLPIFDILQANLPFIVFVIIYLTVILLGAFVIYGMSSLMQYINLKLKNKFKIRNL